MDEHHDGADQEGRLEAKDSARDDDRDADDTERHQPPDRGVARGLEQ